MVNVHALYIGADPDLDDFYKEFHSSQEAKEYCLRANSKPFIPYYFSVVHSPVEYPQNGQK